MADRVLYGQGIVDLWLTEYYMDRTSWICGWQSTIWTGHCGFVADRALYGQGIMAFVADRVLHGQGIVDLWLTEYYMDRTLWICG